MPLSVVCVLRSGGDFTPEDVLALHRQACNHIPLSKFVCLSDMDVPGIEVRPLDHDWEGWWSKLEIFYSDGPTIYLDLDTVLLGSLEGLARAVTKAKRPKFLMLRPFNRAQAWASGVMAWLGDWSFIRDSFNPAIDVPKYSMDQRYICSAIALHGKAISPVQEIQSGVYSYKHHCRAGPPSDARLICFHGKPRPSHVASDWVVAARNGRLQ